MDRKMEMFLDKERWSRAIQHLIDKGVRPSELSEFTTPQFRCWVADKLLSGEYNIAPPRVALIPKGNGEYRKVYVNQTLDRLVLTIINDVYSILYKEEIHPNCVSYQRGIGVKSIMQRITSLLCKGVCGYKVDISKYFDSVNRETMNAVLSSVDTGSCLDGVLYRYYNDDVVVNEHGVTEEKYKSLCQGCATSAFFANLVLRDVDEGMSELCSVYYRYSDDLLILGERADEALCLLQRMLEAKGLKINPKKVERISCDNWFTFLGCKILGDKVTLGKKSLSNFTKEIEGICEQDKGCSKKQLKGKIKRVNRYLYLDYLNNPANFGWAEYFFGIINCEKDIELMDMWVKDMLRGAYTGKGGTGKVGGLGSINTQTEYSVSRGKGRCVTRNKEKTEGLLEECGYVSMHHLWKIFSYIGRDVYRMEVNRTM